MATLATFILVGSIGLIAIDKFEVLYSRTNVQQYLFHYPSNWIASISFVSSIALGIYCIFAIIRPSNFVTLRFKPLLARQYLIIISGFGVYLLLAPIFSFILNFISGDAVFIVSIIAEQISTLGLLLIIIPNFYFIDSGFNLIPQSIEKLAVMNTIGLPLFSHDFGYNERVLYSDILITSSLTAIVTYLTHSEILSSRVNAIKFEDRILIFRIINNFTFLSIVKKRTKILESAIDVFMNEYLKETNPKIARAGFIKTGQSPNPKVKYLVSQCFGTDYDYDRNREQLGSSINNDHTVNFGKLIVAIFFVFSSLRIIIFQGTTILLPNEFITGPIIFIIIYSSLIYLSATLVVFKGYQPINSWFYILFVQYIILIFLNQGLIYLILSWIFGFLCWGYFISVWIHEISNLSPVDKYRIFISGMVIDLISRMGLFGTDITIFRGDQLLFHLVLILTLYFISANLNFSFSYQGKEKTNLWTFLELMTLAIGIHISIRFILNIGRLNILNSDYSEVIYVITSMFWIILLLMSQHDVVIEKIFVYRHLMWFLSVIIISVVVVLPTLQNLILFPLILFGPVSMSFIFAQEWHFTIINSQKSKILFLAVLNFIIPSLMLIATIVNYYGGSVFLLTPFLVLFYFLHFPRFPSRITRNRKNLLVLSLIVLLLSTFTLPSTLDIAHYNSPTMDKIGVMSYNIQYGVDQNFQYRPHQLSKYIISTGVSIVGLLEVTRSSLINGNGDLVFQLIQELQENGYNYFAVMKNDPEIFTNVILSKYPIKTYHYHIFEHNVIYRKGIISAVIEIKHTIIDLGLTHLTHVYTQEANKTRILQTQEVISSFNFKKPTILMGDFNVEPHDVEIQKIVQYFSDNWENKTEPGYTWPVESPNQRIDYIFSKGIYASSIDVPQVGYSDHLPVIAWFEI